MLARQEEAHQAAADALEERLAAEREVRSWTSFISFVCSILHFFCCAHILLVVLFSFVSSLLLQVGVEAVAAEVDELVASGRSISAVAVAELELQRVDREHQAQLEDLDRRLAREKLGKAQKLEARLAERRAARKATLEAQHAIKSGQRKQGQVAEMEARRAALDGDGESTKWLDGVQKELSGGSDASAEQGLIKQLEVEQEKQSSALAIDRVLSSLMPSSVHSDLGALLGALLRGRSARRSGDAERVVRCAPCSGGARGVRNAFDLARDSGDHRNQHLH
tara:strand:- start:183 stop:1022 length:840 start_codon:yes stop_codon:yes gene_type:complete